MGTNSKNSYGCFTHWWAALPAIPSSREGLDWWVEKCDGRCSPYQRLKRVWFDTTRLLSPKTDPCRPHEFAKPSHGTHLTCKAWESLVLFHPADWLPVLLSAAGLDCPMSPADCAWSYEFEAMVGTSSRFKLADIVVHARGMDHSEMLLVIEVKRPGDKLKEDSDLPDTMPASYLDREAFHGIAQRRLIYLVDESYAPIVRSKVNRSDRRWGVLTWAKLAEMQLSLAQSHLPQPLSRFIGMALASQYMDAGITRLHHAPATFGGSEGFLTDTSTRRWAETISAAGPMPAYLSDFVRGALQYLDCLRGVCPPEFAFAYLGSEPSFEQIHCLPKPARQTTAERRRAIWKLPPR